MLNKQIEQTLEEGIKKLKLKRFGRVKFGWNKKSAGVKVNDNSEKVYWVRVQSIPDEQKSNRLWLGEVTAKKIKGIRKPKLIRSLEWGDGHFITRADVLQFIQYGVCSPTPEIHVYREFNQKWWETLKDSLEKLKNVDTSRLAIRQDLINRRVRERFGESVACNVENWETIHADLHWGNLTFPQCWILDWESWGKGPRGMDPAFLYCFSLLCPEIAKKVFMEFEEDLQSHDGRISLMFACSELLRMIELYNNHPELLLPLKKLRSKLARGRSKARLVL